MTLVDWNDLAGYMVDYSIARQRVQITLRGQGDMWLDASDARALAQSLMQAADSLDEVRASNDLR